MKIDPKLFSPRVYSAQYPDGWIHLLMCERRIFKSGATEEKGVGQVMAPPGVRWRAIESYERVLFPCAVRLPLDGNSISDRTKASADFLISGDNRNWTVSTTDTFGISEHAAQCALAEAWLGLEESKADMQTLLPSHRYSAQPLFKSNKRALWSMNAWIRWDAWNKRGLTLPQRASVLNTLGYHVTAKHIENAKAKRGLELPLKSEPGF